MLIQAYRLLEKAAGLGHAVSKIHVRWIKIDENYTGTENEYMALFSFWLGGNVFVTSARWLKRVK